MTAFRGSMEREPYCKTEELGKAGKAKAKKWSVWDAIADLSPAMLAKQRKAWG